VVVSIFRTKAMALLLGPAGFGLMGLYASISDLTQAFAGLGINNSGVRQMAEAAGSGDTERIARTATVLRLTAVAIGLLGALFLFALAGPVSQITFGTLERKTEVRLLAAAVFLSLVAGGQGALIQGMRRISDMARMNVLGALFGAFISVVLVYLFREDGVVPALVSIAGMALLSSWWFSRKIEVRRPQLSFQEVRREASGLLGLGFAFMASSMMTVGSAYLIRIIVSNKLGLDATGLYQAAWTLGGLYVGLVLQAMGADFYPRLTAVVHDHVQCNRLVNEQAHVNMLLAGPGVLATLVLAPLVLQLLYAPQFAEAVDTLRWLCLGVTMRVIGWPLGYILVAKGAKTLFFLSDLFWTGAHLGLAWILVGRFGLEGTGMAFFGAYLMHAGLNYLLARHLTLFRWDVSSFRMGLLLAATVALVLAASFVLPPRYALAGGVILIVVAVLQSMNGLRKLVGTAALAPALQSRFSRIW
jgi:antigen flippase